jgi:hypothetical protein
MRRGTWIAAFAATFAVGIGAGLVTPIVVKAAIPGGMPDGVAVGSEVKVGIEGAPTRLLIDNENVRVSLVTFPAGFKSPPGSKREYDQVLVWLDGGSVTPIKPGTAPQAPTQRGPQSQTALDGSVVPAGTPKPVDAVVWHPKGGNVGPVEIEGKPLRLLYIEIKKS